MSDALLQGDAAHAGILEDIPIANSFSPASWTELKDLLARDSDSCIGIIGLPGTGKTSLLRAACYSHGRSDQYERLRFMVSAPPSADPGAVARELILGLCYALLGERAGRKLRQAPVGAGRQALIASALATVVGSVLLGLSLERVHINTQTGVAAALLLAGTFGLLSRLAVFASGFAMTERLTLIRGTASVDHARRRHGIYERAAALAKTIEDEGRFETTVTSGWTTGMSSSPGLALNLSGSVARRILPMPLPALADVYQQLALAITAETPMLVGIDGFDKCNPGVDINRTLLELQPFLKAPRCRYLIALPEDPKPGASFSSSLIRDMVHCELLTVDDAQKLIGTRAAFPTAFGALCFTTSGGRPKEMLRAVRFVIEVTTRKPDLDISLASREMVEMELRVLADELRWTARMLGSWANQQRLYDWASQLTSSPRTADSVLAVADSIRSLEIDTPEMAPDESDRRRVTQRITALAYFYATLLEFFTDGLDDEALIRARAPNAANASLDQLAEARRLIDTGTCGPAWNEISAFRAEWKMRVIHASL